MDSNIFRLCRKPYSGTMLRESNKYQSIKLLVEFRMAKLEQDAHNSNKISFALRAHKF